MEAIKELECCEEWSEDILRAAKKVSRVSRRDQKQKQHGGGIHK